jgi:hypothetical protein
MPALIGGFGDTKNYKIIKLNENTTTLKVKNSNINKDNTVSISKYHKISFGP